MKNASLRGTKIFHPLSGEAVERIVQRRADGVSLNTRFNTPWIEPHRSMVKMLPGMLFDVLRMTTVIYLILHGFIG